MFSLNLISAKLACDDVAPSAQRKGMSILDRAHGYMRAPREVLLSLKVWQHWHEVRVLRFDLEEEARNTI